VKAVQDEGASVGEPVVPGAEFVRDPHGVNARLSKNEADAHSPSLTLAVDPEEPDRRPGAPHHGLWSLPVRTA
jgi:hypothetical protein